ncbi:hypothetical protein TrVE_jg6280 [Triparma verrucosa]|uniref:Uncharacterized protein n=1 Tax=Triparma verrucosa TaxID=1606542 RepID=A0A9W7BFZ7_9STRA|nr:hypothetical protein TrVE_jg6280 [Triparma verrucosa]
MSTLFPPPLLLTSTLTPLSYTFTLTHPSSPSPLASTTGFKRLPPNLLHMDTMTIDRRLLKRLSLTGSVNSNNLGVMLGCVALRWGYERGCSRVEFLAIDDSEFQHKRLVRHWRRLGLKEVRYVGDDVKDVPDRLVWGGRGMLMEGGTVELLEKWKRVWEKKDDEQEEA